MWISITVDTIPACDRQTDGRTDILPRHIRAMHTRRAVKIRRFITSCRTETETVSRIEKTVSYIVVAAIGQ